MDGTCEWFYEDDRFLHWRNSKESRVLWVSAGPGCGKSVLSRSLIDERRVCTDATTSTVCYFFFKEGQEQRTRGSDALSAIIHQLYENDALIIYARESHKRNGTKLREMPSELWDILTKSASDPEAGEIVCILDGLDECELSARMRFTEKLAEFFSRIDKKKSCPFAFKFLVTSRPYDDIEQEFRQYFQGVGTVLHFDGDDKLGKIGQEINLVIDAKLPIIVQGLNEDNRLLISERLKSKDNRTYLWLFLTFDIIMKSPSRFSKTSDIESLLSKLPSDVSDAYERILSKSSDPKRAQIILHIIIAARRPLSLDEVNIALTLTTQERGCKSFDELDLWPQERFKSVVQNMCGLFVSIHDGKLSLIHQTARAFLIGTTAAYETTPQMWKGRVNSAVAHGILARVCLSYLNLDGFLVLSSGFSEEDFCRDNEWKNSLQEEQCCGFLDYAALNWANHYKSKLSDATMDLENSARDLCDTRLAYRSWWFRLYMGDHTHLSSKKCTSLIIASIFGLTRIAEHFLAEGADIYTCVNPYGNALSAASERGHNDVVQLLLDQGADVNFKDSCFGGALTAACSAGSYSTVQLLLDKGAKIHDPNRYWDEPLLAASLAHLSEVVRLQLNRGADINPEREEETALMAALPGVLYKLVQLMLDTYGDRNPEREEETALEARSLRIKEIVHMLHDGAADFSARPYRYGSALYAAAEEGHDRILRVLLEKGANINAKSGKYGSVLHAAAFYGRDEIVRILLDRGADINAEGGDYGSAIQAAAAFNQGEVVRILLDRGANVNAEGKRRSSALQVAAMYGNVEVLQILLDRGANINAEGGYYSSAMQEAAAKGHREALHILLDHEYIVRETLDDDTKERLFQVRECRRYGERRRGSSSSSSSSISEYE